MMLPALTFATVAVMAPARSEARKAAVSATSARVGSRFSSVPCSRTAFGCYLPDPQAAIARPYGFVVLTLEGDAIAAITWFADTGVFRHFGLPPTLPSL